MTSLKQLAVRGILWTTLSYGVSIVLRLGSNLLLTRLLFPELFGLMSLVSTLILGLQLFSDFGLIPSIVQSKRGDDPVFLNTAWTLQIVRGFALWICSALIALPMANFYREPQLLWLIPIIGINTVLSGFNSTALLTLNRHLILGRLTLMELGTTAISLAVTLIWAWFSPTVWAIVVGTVTADVFTLFWSHQLVPGHHNRLAWEQASVKELFSFGKWIFASTAATFLAGQADRLIMGKLVPLELLGIYGIALTFASMPTSMISTISSNVIFPSVAKLADLPRQALRAKILRSRAPILIVAALILAMIVSFGDTLIVGLYDKRYAQAAWMLPILAFGIWPNVLLETSRNSLVAIGKPAYQAYGQFLKCLTVCVGIPLGFSIMGMVGAVTVVALNDLPLYGVIAYGLQTEGLGNLKQDIQLTLLFVGFLTVLLTARIMLGFGLPIDPIFTLKPG